MSASDQSPDERASSSQRRVRVLQPGVIPFARMVSGIFDYAEGASSMLYERLGGKSHRASGDLDGLVADLGKAIKDKDTAIRLAAVQTLGHVGRTFQAYPGDVATATEAAVSVLSSALTDRDADIREAALVALANFPTAASSALVDRVSRAAEDPNPRVRRASIAVLRVFGPKAPPVVVGALIQVIAAPVAQDDELVQMAVEGLADCGQDAASEAVETLAIILRDARLAATTRIAACKVLGWLGADARPAVSALADVAIGSGVKSNTVEVRLAVVQALVSVADLSWLAAQATHAEQQRDLLSLLRQIGPEATNARRALQSMWEQGPPALKGPTAAPATAPPASMPADLGAERIAALESTLSRIEKGMKASQAASPEKRLYTVKEVAGLTEFSDWTIRDACAQGRIKAQKGPNGQWRIPRDELVKIQNEGLPK